MFIDIYVSYCYLRVSIRCLEMPVLVIFFFKKLFLYLWEFCEALSNALDRLATL